MTIGEKIAWIWVWTASALVSVALAIAISLYWSLPVAYFNALACDTANKAIAAPACERLLSFAPAPTELRPPAFRRLAELARDDGKAEVAIGHLSSLIQTGMAGAEDWNLRGLEYYALHDYGKAASDFHMAALIASSEGMYWSNLGDARIENQEFAAAIDSYTVAMRKGNDNAEMRGNRGWARYQLNSYENALADYDKAVAMDAGHADNFNERGLVHHALKNYDAAIKDFDEALRLKKASEIVILTNRAVSHSSRGDTDKARQDLDLAISLDPKYTRARLEKAWLWIDHNQAEKAMPEFAALERIAPLDVLGFEARSQAHLDLGRWEDAIADANRAIDLGSKAGWLHYVRAKAKYELADFEAAITDATAYLRHAPAHVDARRIRAYSSRRLAQLTKDDRKSQLAVQDFTSLIQSGIASAEDWNGRGLSYFVLRDYDKATIDFHTAALIASSEGAYWSNLGDAQLHSGKYAAAIDNYTIATRKGYDNAELRGDRGWARYQLGNLQSALEDFDKAIAMDGKHAANFNDRGLVRHTMQDYRGAVADFDESLKLEPGDAIVLTNRAVCHARLGNREKTRQDLDRAISLKPNYAPAYVERAWLWINQNQPDKAMPEFTELERIAPLPAYAFEARSQAHHDLGQWKETIEDVDRAFGMGSQTSWLYQLRARARYELANFEGAIEDATAHLKHDPANASTLAIRAYSLQQTGRNDAAFADMDKAIKESSDPAYAYRVRTYLNLNAGRLKDAVSDAREAVVLAPGSVDSSVVLGRALLESGQTTSALSECSRALTLRETYFAYRCRALAHLALNEQGKALIDANKALQLKVSSGNYYALGRIELVQGNARLALERFNRAVDMDTYAGAGASLLMYRGDAERLLGKIDDARRDYQEAKRQDAGLYSKALDERLSVLPAQQKSGP